MTHTPAPWKAVKEKWDIAIIGSDEEYVAYVPVDDSLVLLEESYNARLIAAAPDLLEALEDVLNYLRNTPHAHDCKGWQCSECYPEIMAGKVEQAIARAEDGDA